MRVGKKGKCSTKEKTWKVDRVHENIHLKIASTRCLLSYDQVVLQVIGSTVKTSALRDFTNGTFLSGKLIKSRLEINSDQTNLVEMLNLTK